MVFLSGNGSNLVGHGDCNVFPATWIKAVLWMNERGTSIMEIMEAIVSERRKR
jgi:hypothetical protein